MKRTLAGVLVGMLLLAACSPASAPQPARLPAATEFAAPSAAPSLAPLPAAASTLTAAPRPRALLNQAADLFNGPGSSHYEVLTRLAAGGTVYPLAAYGDFMQVETPAGQTGFLWKGALRAADLAASPPAAVLSAAQVPWEPFFNIQCYAYAGVGPNGEMILSNATDAFNDPQSSFFSNPAPLKIVFQADAKAFGSIYFVGTTAKKDWWDGLLRLDVAVDQGEYRIGIRNGTSADWVSTLALHTPTSQPITLIFNDAQGKTLTVYDQHGKVVGEVDLASEFAETMPNGLFPDRKVRFGFSVSPHADLTLKEFSATSLPNGKWSPVRLATAGAGLKDLALRRGITIGTDYEPAASLDPRYCQAMKRDFNVAVIGDLSFQQIWRGRGDYDFGPMDAEIDAALRQGYPVRVAHLVWGATEESGVLPDWLLKGKFTRAEYIQILVEHVQTLAKRYRGKVSEWSIANEAISRTQWAGSDFWMDKIGPEYIEISFRAARAADPRAVLIFNDSNNESPRDASSSYVIDKMYATVRDLKAKGVPIDVVGMQMHLLLQDINPTAPKKADVTATMKKFGALGVKLYITELDIDVSHVPGTRAQKWDYQANLYRDMLQACLDSEVCTSFTTWGISDSGSWITCMEPYCSVRIPDADPLMFDQDFNPKPAYFAVLDALR